MRSEAMAAPFQIGLAFGIVEKLAVENRRDRAIFIADRLPAIVKVTGSPV